MQRIVWMTDIHLNFLQRPDILALCRQVAQMNPDAVLLSGDIGDARTIEGHLETFENLLACPIYFVLGNHDFYHGSIAEVRGRIKSFTAGSRRLHWLPEAGIVALTEKTCLVGCESWADGRWGDYAGSRVMLNDYFLIEELTGLRSSERLEKIQELAGKAAAGMEALLHKALARFEMVVLLTHVPPFREACRYQGRITQPEWLPHFSCRAVGEVIIAQMSRYRNRKMLVLCGHTHEAVRSRILKNVEVRVGGAVYGAPCIQEIFRIR